MSIQPQTNHHQQTIDMSPQLELFVLPWGVYPRRVLFYLSEKGLSASPLIKITPVTVTSNGMDAPGKPPGSVPILKLPDGTFIKQSIAIMEYLEDICDNPDPGTNWQVELSKTAGPNSSMRGNSPEERARTRELLALADEATSQFCFACHKGVALFVPLERTSAIAADLALEHCQKTLRLLDNYFAQGSHLIDGSRFSVAHCALFSLLQFSKDLYGVDLLAEPELAAISTFRQSFQQRDRPDLEEPQYPHEIKSLANQWLSLE